MSKLQFTGSLLENLLSLEATRMSNYPTLEELLENQFFSNAIGSISKDSHGRKQYLKFSASTKETLAKHKSDFESRLLEDHKKVMIDNLRYSYENTRKTWNTDFIIVCQNLIGLYS